MNKKSRLLLPTIGLVVLSGIAATSTTFAWFTTVRTAKVTMERAKVISKDSNLIIDHAHSWNSEAALGNTVTKGTETTPYQIAYTGVPLITDISGDGKDFYKPIWQVAPTTASRIENVTPSAEGGADGYLVDFTIEISRGGSAGAEGLYVYLGKDTKIEPYTAADGDADQFAKDQKAVAGARMSVYTSTAAGAVGTKIFVHSPVAETVNANKYLAAETSDDGAYDTTTHVVKDDLGVKSDAFITAGTNAAAKTPYPALAYLKGSELPAGNEVTNAFINFRFWVEGEDSDTTNSMVEGQFKVTLDLYALAWNA